MDKELIRIIKEVSEQPNLSGDLYTHIASLWLGKSIEDVTLEERRTVKTFAFPWMYSRKSSEEVGSRRMLG